MTLFGVQPGETYTMEITPYGPVMWTCRSNSTVITVTPKPTTQHIECEGKP